MEVEVERNVVQILKRPREEEDFYNNNNDNQEIKKIKPSNNISLNSEDDSYLDDDDDEEYSDDEQHTDEQYSDDDDEDFETKSKREIIEKRKLKGEPRKEISVYDLTCSYCLKVFSRASKLEYHLRTHTGEKPYVCKFEGCKKAFSRSHHLSYHEKTHSPVEERIPCPTPGCKSSFIHKHHLQTHIKSKHSNTNNDQDGSGSEKTYKCTHDEVNCQLSFSKHNQLKRHISIVHLNELPYECKECNMRFEYPSYLKKHNARRHDGIPTNICMFPGCKEKFVTLLELQKHRKKSHTITYQCDQCPSSFKNSSKLNEHRKVHTAIEDRKEFHCTYPDCFKTYITKSGLDSHIKSIHLKQLFTCELPKINIVLQTEPKSIKVSVRKKIKSKSTSTITSPTTTTSTNSTTSTTSTTTVNNNTIPMPTTSNTSNTTTSTTNIDTTNLESSEAGSASPTIKEESINENQDKQQQQHEHNDNICGQTFTTKKNLFRHIELMHKKTNNTKVIPSKATKLIESEKRKQENKIKQNINSLVGKKPSFAPDDSIYD